MPGSILIRYLTSSLGSSQISALNCLKSGGLQCLTFSVINTGSYTISPAAKKQLSSSSGYSCPNSNTVSPERLRLLISACLYLLHLNLSFAVTSSIPRCLINSSISLVSSPSRLCRIGLSSPGRANGFVAIIVYSPCMNQG